MILPSSSAPPMKMPNWYYEKRQLRNTPSIRDGLDFDTEQRYRKEGARFIMECGTKMGLGHSTMATGVVYFHRFYVFQSFKSFPRYVTACCCLFLAGKVEETPKKCRDIIKMARSMLSDQKFQSFGEDTKEEVMTLERILLQTIKFDLQVEHPYSFLVKYAKCLKGDQVKLQKMVQMAWNFVNDSLSTTVCLQWEPEIIAVALIHLASKLSKFSVTKWDGQMPTHLRWWDMFVADVTMEILEDICHQVLDLYQQPNQMGVDSPPQLPPSKSSPPAKRAKISPVYAKSSPSSGVTGSAITVQTAGGHQSQSVPLLPNHHAVGGVGATVHHHSHGAHQQPAMQSHHKASIDEKLLNMPMQRNAGPMSSLDPMAYGAHSYGSNTAYGTMFQHAQFGPPPSGGGQQPPLPPQQQQQQSGMFAGNQTSHAYGPPQQIPTHYQSGGGGGGSSGAGSGSQMQSQGYYQQPPPPGRGGGGYYQGPA